jgi:hypothetical protein
MLPTNINLLQERQFHRNDEHHNFFFILHKTINVHTIGQHC